MLLYSPQWLLLAVVAAAPGLAGRVGGVAMAVAAGANLLLNAPALRHPASHDPARCCPVPPPTMLEREHPATQAGLRRGCGAVP